MAKKTLILDIDETLVSTQDYFIHDEIYTNPELFRKYHPRGKKQICYSINFVNENYPVKLWGVIRPGTEEFLHFAQNYFENIIVWSAGVKPYVELICKELFSSPGLYMPKVIWSRDNCILEKGFYHKPIANLIESYQDSHLDIDIRKTLILDDRKYTFYRNPTNGIQIPMFKPENNLTHLCDRSDNNLSKFMNWLKKPEILNTEDFRLVDKTRIFI